MKVFHIFSNFHFSQFSFHLNLLSNWWSPNNPPRPMALRLRKSESCSFTSVNTIDLKMIEQRTSNWTIYSTIKNWKNDKKSLWNVKLILKVISRWLHNKKRIALPNKTKNDTWHMSRRIPSQLLAPILLQHGGPVKLCIYFVWLMSNTALGHWIWLATSVEILSSGRTCDTYSLLVIQGTSFHSVIFYICGFETWHFLHLKCCELLFLLQFAISKSERRITMRSRNREVI